MTRLVTTWSDRQLPSRYVAHTVGPVYAKTKVAEKAQQLESCYLTSLESCKQHGGGSIGFSSISTGICKPLPCPAK